MERTESFEVAAGFLETNVRAYNLDNIESRLYLVDYTHAPLNNPSLRSTILSQAAARDRRHAGLIETASAGLANAARRIVAEISLQISAAIG
jgi:hypothetical protein